MEKTILTMEKTFKINNSDMVAIDDLKLPTTRKKEVYEKIEILENDSITQDIKETLALFYCRIYIPNNMTFMDSLTSISNYKGCYEFYFNEEVNMFMQNKKVNDILTFMRFISFFDVIGYYRMIVDTPTKIFEFENGADHDTHNIWGVTLESFDWRFK